MEKLVVESIVPVKHLIMVGSPKIRVKSNAAKTTAIYDPDGFVVNNIGSDSEYNVSGGITYYKPGKTINNITLEVSERFPAFLGGHTDYFDEKNYEAVGYEILQVIKGAIK